MRYEMAYRLKIRLARENNLRTRDGRGLLQDHKLLLGMDYNTTTNCYLGRTGIDHKLSLGMDCYKSTDCYLEGTTIGRGIGS